MIRKYLCLALCGCGAFLLFHSEASAKTVNMGSLSRDTVSFACRRAGGVPYGTQNGSDQYGCSAAYAVVACSDDAGCVATVNDLTPVPGNSIDTVLSIGQPAPPPAVQPLNARVQQQYKPQTP
jgi:hypothetical protein